MKALLLISAALAGLLVGYWIGRMTPQETSSARNDSVPSSEPDRIPIDQSGQDKKPSSEQSPQRIGVVTNADEPPDGSPVALLNRPSVSPAEGQDALLDRLKSVASQPPAPDVNSEQESTASWHERAQRRLLAEPEDTAWAPYMENAITLFLSRHPAAKEFDIEYVECRTSQCQIKAMGYEASTGPSWQRIVQDMLREPWASFGQSANASGPHDGRLVIVQDLRRKE